MLNLLLYSTLSPTGLIWLIDSGRAVKGEAAGSLTKDGYYRVSFGGYHFRAHRLVAYIKGIMTEEQFENPNVMVDHIDGVRTNNDISNLRIVDSRLNTHNKVSHREGKLVGASYYRKTNKWKSQISIDGKKKHLGYFATEQQASDAYMRALQEMADETSEA